ncbi:MAG: lamin tail domain-containing protein [Planctomycetales bacterium]|nr:lamin tail domain-containing protein [Planctomycetales bacterium]
MQTNVRQRLKLETLESRCLLAGDLRVTEINYNPHPSMTQFGERDADADDYEFIEVANVGDAPLQLKNYEFTEGIEFKFDRQIIQPGERLVIVQDPQEFVFRYGTDPKLADGDGGDKQDNGEFAGSLKNGGETLVLKNPSGAIVQQFTFFDLGEWPRRADGGGSTLEVIDPLGDLNDPKNWRASAEYGGSPGWEGEGPRGDIVINELLTHTDLPDVDTIELSNRTRELINIGGWYVTDSVANPFRYTVPAGTEITGGDYFSFDEVTLGFSFRGQESDNAFVIEPDETGKPLRFADGVSYGATQNGVTLGRWDDGIGELFPMIDRSFDDENSGPLISDVVISEVHYNPKAKDGVETDDLEFVEITNNSGVPLDLSQWQLAKSVSYIIPTGFIIPAHTSIVVVGFDPDNEPAKLEQFMSTYGVANDAEILGPYSDATDPNPDQLDDNGETLILQRPEDILQLGLGYVLVDRVIYDDDGDWPTAADGQGRSLTRNDLRAYGDYPETWTASLPTPGTLKVVGDIDGDGKVGANDIDQLCIAISFGGNPSFDINFDGAVNRDDFDYMIETVLNSEIGDSNLDGQFNSSDFVTVFTAGEYEDGLNRNSGWAEGDWNCDGDFTSSDLVTAFQAATYSEFAKPVTANSLVAANLELNNGTKQVTVHKDRMVETIDVQQRAQQLSPAHVDSLFAS